MSKYDMHVCQTCGKTFEYCGSCVFVRNPILEQGFCSQNCIDIFKVLSKNGCHLATAEETLESLAKLPLPERFQSGIQAHIDSLKEEVKPKQAEALKKKKTE